ncbi:hypothetical protein J2W48_004027 [Flavobacterium piscis]|uniref:Uncharacterized protein n=1 Tax=Flavobacterium piscis TaxID=1114874 RepID=A0ABU1YCV9_9FLAO|nr:hypothetical protein [Flavobacterium piscis]
MHSVPIKLQTETWIAAISEHKEETIKYSATLSSKIQAAAF